MGWTHHWERSVELPPKQFKQAVEDLRALLPELPVELAGFDGGGEPMLADDHIVFNGRLGEHCEPFEIARVEFDRRGRGYVSSFCKTEQMPYDIAVQAVLIVLKHHLGDEIRVASDGTGPAWSDARRRVQASLGYGEDVEIEVTGYA